MGYKGKKTEYRGPKRDNRHSLTDWDCERR